MTKTSTFMKIKIKNRMNKFVGRFLEESALSLIEILVALFLVTLIFVVSNFQSPGIDKLREVVDDINRAYRFSRNETILLNAPTRVHFFIDKSPQEMTVEYGPKGSFTLPSLSKFDDEAKLSLSEKEELEKVHKKINKNFNRVTEYSEENYKFPENIRIIGVGHHHRNSLLLQGEVSIYFFPTGEQETSLVTLGYRNTVAAIVNDPFGNEVRVSYFSFEAKDIINEEDYIDAQDKLAQEVFEKWKKNDL